MWRTACLRATHRSTTFGKYATINLKRFSRSIDALGTRTSGCVVSWVTYQRMFLIRVWLYTHHHTTIAVT
jgi:hypothetical protein